MIWAWIILGVILLFGFVVFRGAPYVPSRRKYIEQAFTELYPLSERDVLVDVGSGDGIVLRIAAEHKAKAVGLELNPVLVVLARWLSRRDQRVKVHWADFWIIPLPNDVTVVYTFIATAYIAKLTKKLQRETDRLNRPLHLIIYANALPDRPAKLQVGAYRLYTFVPLQIHEA